MSPPTDVTTTRVPSGDQDPPVDRPASLRNPVPSAPTTHTWWLCSGVYTTNVRRSPDGDQEIGPIRSPIGASVGPTIRCGPLPSASITQIPSRAPRTPWTPAKATERPSGDMDGYQYWRACAP